MTVDEIEKEVLEIAAVAGDPEVAHTDEDDLYREVMQAIADGAENAQELAAAALKTKELDFPRWCA